ncbi:MAG: recombinase family protein [Balneolaceae bacterium]
MTPTKENEKLKAAGYVRVSSSKQVEGESLSTQRKSITDYCKQQGYKLTEIYADEGISGGTVKDRPDLLKCLYDAGNGKFDVLVVHRLSRLGRNARELLNNVEELSQSGIQLRSISEGIDFGSKYGKAMLGILAIIAELEREIMQEQMFENRIARGRKGRNITKPPFGRSFNKKTGKWVLDEEAARLVQWAADEYLKGESLRELSETLRTRHDQPLGYHNLIKVLKTRSGDTWTVKFEDEEPIEYQIPRILDDETIQRVKDRLEHNKIDNRRDVRRYVLTGFIRCEACGKSLSGQTQINKYGTKFKYYNHPGGKYEKCKAFNSVPLEQIENAVFRTIFENMADVPSFEKAISQSLPDEKLIKGLNKKIKAGEKDLKKLNRELDKLVDLAMSGTLKKETIREKEQSLLKAKTQTVEELEETRSILNDLPDPESVKQEADQIRRELLHKYSGEEHLQEMTFGEKRQLLHWLFDGSDKGGTPYGIYITKKGKGAGVPIDYFMYGRLTGLRTVKGDDIDYNPDDGNNGDSSGNGTVTNTKRTTYKGNRVYNTNRQNSCHHYDLYSCFKNGWPCSEKSARLNQKF